MSCVNCSACTRLRATLLRSARSPAERVVCRCSFALSSARLWRGNRLTLTLDEDAFTGGSAFLFAEVLDVFFGLYAGINTFTQLVLKTCNRKGRVQMASAIRRASADLDGDALSRFRSAPWRFDVRQAGAILEAWKGRMTGASRFRHHPCWGGPRRGLPGGRGSAP
ncbi:MAG: type VI secretion system baseplate subunit TssF [Bilophila wadsworthia]